MDFTIQKKALVEAMSRLSGVASKGKSGLALLSNVCLSAKEDGYLEAYATNLDIGMQITVPCEVSQPGEILLDAKKMLAIIKGYPSEVLRMSDRENFWVDFSNPTSAARYSLAGLPAQDFPAPPVVDGSAFPCDSSAILDMIHRTVPFVSHEASSKLELMGVLWEQIEKDGLPVLCMVASDSLRLSYVAGAAMAGWPFASMIVSANGLVRLKELCGLGDTFLKLSTANRFLQAEAANTRLFIRLIDGKFPPYQRIIPESFAHELTLNRAGLLSILQRLATVVEDQYFSAVVTLSDGMMAFQNASAQVVEAFEQIPVDYTGEEIKTCWNCRLVAEFLEVMTTEQVLLRFNDPQRSSFCLSEAGNDAFLGLFMPIVL
jgi:DNA polymerase-3 subunit beta